MSGEAAVIITGGRMGDEKFQRRQGEKVFFLCLCLEGCFSYVTS